MTDNGDYKVHVDERPLSEEEKQELEQLEENTAENPEEQISAEKDEDSLSE